MRWLVLAICAVMAGCAVTRVQICGSENVTVRVEQPRTVDVTPSIKADGNTVPISAMP